MDINNNIISVLSFNCKSFKRSMECVASFSEKADIIALQETWLLPHEISELGRVNRNFSYHGKSAVDTSQGILRGRPFGGVALLWNKLKFSCVSVVDCKSDRITALKFSAMGRDFIVFSVYMPTDCSENLLEYVQCLSEIVAIIENYETETIYILGDFNAHPGELFGRELINFCYDQKWCCVDMNMLGSDTYTFVSEAHGSRRWLDHCLTTESARRSVVSVKVRYDVYWSDHFPLEIQCNINTVPPPVQLPRASADRIIWGI